MLVLDTHAWLWWLHQPDRLSTPAQKVIRAAEEEGAIRVSSISVWEVAIKHRLGKLSLPLDIHRWFAMASRYPGIVIEPLDAAEAIESTLLPGDFHQDPVDRIIVALARRYDARLVTVDEKILAYPHVRTVA